MREIFLVASVIRMTASVSLKNKLRNNLVKIRVRLDFKVTIFRVLSIADYRIPVIIIREIEGS